MYDLLLSYEKVILFFHFVGFVVGLGGATYSDLIFFRCLKDLKIDQKETELLHFLSKVIWVGIFILATSGFLLFSFHSERLLQSPAFITKMVMVFVIIVNGLYLNFKVSPTLIKLKFGCDIDMKCHYLRRHAFAGGVISMTSWYGSLFIAVTKGFGYNTLTLLSAYFLVLFIGITLSQIVERKV